MFQAQPEVLFEATLAEGESFRLKAAIADPSGFTNFDAELLELEFRSGHFLLKSSSSYVFRKS